MTNEKIPVWIWYKDINQTQVDNIVKTRTGLTAENAAVDYAMPSPALLNSLQNEEPGSQAQMQAYLAATAQARALETQRADTLIMTRREVAREQYNVKSAEIIEEVNLDADDIIFKSQYAPVIITYLTREEIKQAVYNQNVEEIDFYVDEGEPLVLETENTTQSSTSMTFDSSRESIGVNKVHEKTGLKGTGVKVGMFEYGAPLEHEELDPEKVTIVGTNVEKQDHPRWMAICIVGKTFGIAPDALLYATNDDYSNIELLISQGIKVLNVSWGQYTNNYSSHDKWFDHMAIQHNLLLICSAGNEEGTRTFVRAPAMAYNTIGVGAVHNMGTGTIDTDDKLNTSSSYNHTGSYKPDLVATMGWSNDTQGATSAAAAVVTGVSALMLELKPSLAYQPHVMKAILMASCQRKVRSHTGNIDETMSQGITRTQGVGIIDAWNAICIISQGQYGYGTFSGAEEARYFVQPPYGASHMNVSVTWLRNNTASGDHTSVSNVTAGTQHNIHLQVYRGETLAGSSALANSSTEMAYIPLSSTSTQYKLRLYKADSTNTESVRYAYAWSTDNMRYNESASTTPQDEPIDGFFYIRNQNNGQYLTVNESTGQVTSAPFSGGRNQQWIIGKTDSYGYTTIKTRSLTYPGNLSRAASGNNAVIDQDTEYLVYFSMFSSTGAHSITHGMQGIAYVHLQLVDGAFQWATYGAPTNFQWHFERVGYQKGDVNLDGSLTVADATLIQQYALEMVTFNDDQLYLADLDNSGTITILDATLLQKLIMGLL